MNTGYGGNSSSMRDFGGTYYPVSEGSRHSYRMEEMEVEVVPAFVTADDDVEQHRHGRGHGRERGYDTSYLSNHIVQSFSWNAINVAVREKKMNEPKVILQDAAGHVAAGKESILRSSVGVLGLDLSLPCPVSVGLCERKLSMGALGEVMAIMGPSGSGKTTLLNVLASRTASSNSIVTGTVLINHQLPSKPDLRRLSSYVECDDALVGSLTVAETLYFAAKLSLTGSHGTTAERKARIAHLLSSFGLTKQSDTIVGTLVRKGLSTGQRRRLSIAAQLLSAPKILFLDEPTSGWIPRPVSRSCRLCETLPGGITFLS
jgi:ABC-type uncharacterized transport system YnjBCD ATPase subunit